MSSIAFHERGTAMKLRSLILASLTLSLCVAGYVLAKSENGQAADKITGGLVIVTTDK